MIDTLEFENKTYDYSFDYTTKPEDFTSYNVFDLNVPTPETNYKWLDDFGWI